MSYFFTNYYNKWYISEEEKFKWSNFRKQKNICILACMVSAFGTTLKEIIPEKGGRRKTGYVYLAKHINDELAVKGKT